MPNKARYLFLCLLSAAVLCGGQATMRADEASIQSTAESNARSQRTRERGIQFPKLVRGNPDVKVVALTFDDGPHGPATEKLLDILHKEGVRATFFLVGKMVDKHQDLRRRGAGERHAEAHHTHASMPPPSCRPAR